MRNNCNILQCIALMLHDKSIDLPGNLPCRVTVFECLRHTTLACRKKLHHCDLKTTILYFLNLTVTSVGTIIYRF